MTNKIKERKLHRQCNNGFACRNVGYAIQKWMPIIPLTSPLPTSNCGMWQCVGFDLPTIHLHGSALPCASTLFPSTCFFPPLSPFLYYASAIFISFDSLSIYIYLHVAVQICIIYSCTLCLLLSNSY